MTGPASAPRPSVAVIGAGVSGLTAAYLLARTHDVTLYEAEDRLGGHAHTHDVAAGDGSRHAVDSGFIVHNDRTYPLLRRLFAELGVEAQPTEMSMSIRCEDCGLEYAGGRGLRGILAQPGRLFDRRFVRMLLQVKRFHRRATSFLERTDDSDQHDLRRVPGAGGFQRALRHPLRRARRLLRVVLRAGHRPAVPRPLPVPLPRPPRDAQGRPGRRSGTPSSAGLAPMSSGSASCSRQCGRGCAVTARLARLPGRGGRGRHRGHQPLRPGGHRHARRPGALGAGRPHARTSWRP